VLTELLEGAAEMLDGTTELLDGRAEPLSKQQSCWMGQLS